MDERLKEAKEFFDNMAPRWDSYSINDPEGIGTIVSLSGLGKNAKTADIACGTGALFGELLKREPERIWGIDLSEKMLEQARLKYDDRRISLWAGDFFEFGEKDFDIAFAYRAYPHFPDKSAFAHKLYSILKTGGRFMICHSESRHAVNHRHSGSAAHVSDILAPAAEEAKVFDSLFDIDITVDTERFYIISGTKR
ncbi:MAG: class I SAM-dependent methyltransferase [Clostridia bacterium]|nr:class I SAM-dependent methyltransferase [Clostridia bacterium]